MQLSNELLFIFVVLAEIFFLIFASRFGKSWLFVSIVINLLMVTLFGSKFISRFGLASNTGTVSYASVFFATQLLVYYYGRAEAIKSIFIAIWALGFFLIMAKIATLTTGLPQAHVVSGAIEILFGIAPRVGFASLFAYLISQLININLFEYLQGRLKGNLFLSINITNLVGQLIDSAVFFTIAFSGTIPSVRFLAQALVSGYLLKVTVGFLSSLAFPLGRPDDEAKD